jgi:hypothetical protein
MPARSVTIFYHLTLFHFTDVLVYIFRFVQFDVDQMKFGCNVTKVNSNGKSHKTKVSLKFVKDTQQFVVVWESESMWKSSADCQSSFFCLSVFILSLID